jgi:hypothetical protein
VAGGLLDGARGGALLFTEISGDVSRLSSGVAMAGIGAESPTIGTRLACGKLTLEGCPAGAFGRTLATHC